MKKSYFAIVHQEDGEFWAEFPTLLGCFSEGDTLEEILENCKDAASLHIASLFDNKKEIPQEVSLEDAKKSLKDKKALLIPIMVEMPAKTQRIAITIPEDRLAIIDSYVKKHNTNRSAFLVNSAINRIQA